MSELDYLSQCEDDTQALGQVLANALLGGSGTDDLLLFSGDLGSVKTTLARSIIRHVADDPEYEVPSPTYTICQQYELRLNLSHYDLYRISGMDELDELGWEEAVADGVAIIEWPENCFEKPPSGSVQVTIEIEETIHRRFKFCGEGDLFGRIKRGIEKRDFLRTADLAHATSTLLAADASARSYEIVTAENQSFFLMDSPRMPDGPIIRDGKPYSQIAHLAETVDSFVAVSKMLIDLGVKAPHVPHYDLDRGLLLIEDLGNQGIINANREPMKDRYMAAVEMLAAFHQNDIPEKIPVDETRLYTVPKYDQDAVLIEAELLLDWYVPEYNNVELSVTQKREFVEIWQELYEVISAFETGLVLRDFHSPNILWLASETGTSRVGVIDFQDALIGPTAYDVASLAQDARIGIDRDLEQALLDHYIACREQSPKYFAKSEFLTSYAIMSAQRATKILGIFVRLNRRDGKPEYLKHLPRIKEYLERSLDHPMLSEYKEWLTRAVQGYS